MKKPLAGKRYFEAMGRRSTSLKWPRTSEHYKWPKWAQQAFMRGRLLQGAINIAKRNNYAK